MSTTSPDLLLELDRSRPRGLRAQIEDGLRDAIRSGRLTPGARLPSSRALATDLAVTRGVVVEAYDQLAAEGYVTSVHGSGTVVNDVGTTEPGAGARDGSGAGAGAGAGAGRPPASPGPPAALRYDFRTGLPDLSLFPRAAWAQATRAALASMPDDELGYGDSAGLPRLRQAVADYLGRVRGVCCTPDQVVICNGFNHGFSLLLRVLIDRGITDVAMEDPGYADPRERVVWSGARVHPIPVDEEGLRVDELAAGPARAVVVTPAHQYPTGVVLSPARRTALVGWAHAEGAYVIEDDYDAEYRFDRQPVGAVQGVAPERVIYSGTMSKSLAPGLRLGWLVVPDDLVDDVVHARTVTDRMAPTLIQATFVEFLVRGDLDRHLRRSRRVYRQRRDALVAALDRWLPDVRVGGVAAGLTALVTLPHGWDSREVKAVAEQHGVGVYLVEECMDDTFVASTLLLGYGTLRPDQIDQGIRHLATAVETGR